MKFSHVVNLKCFVYSFLGRDRSKYLLIKTAKIIAMTCTHAALRRRDLVELNFKVSTLMWVIILTAENLF